MITVPPVVDNSLANIRAIFPSALGLIVPVTNAIKGVPGSAEPVEVTDPPDAVICPLKNIAVPPVYVASGMSTLAATIVALGNVSPNLQPAVEAAIWCNTYASNLYVFPLVRAIVQPLTVARAVVVPVAVSPCV